MSKYEKEVNEFCLQAYELGKQIEWLEKYGLHVSKEFKELRRALLFDLKEAIEKELME